MATTSLTSLSSGFADDSFIGLSGVLSWSAIRGTSATSGNISSTSVASNDFGVYNIYSSGRGGNEYVNRRSYYSWNLSSINGKVSEVRVKLYLDALGTTGTSSRVVLVRATLMAGTLADYGNCFSSGSTLGTQLADFQEVSTTAGYHNFDFLTDGISEVQTVTGTGTTFSLALMGHVFDYRNTSPSLGGNYTKIKCYYSEGASSTDPIMEITYEPHNAVFMGHNF
jgi:hypothetical protein